MKKGTEKGKTINSIPKEKGLDLIAELQKKRQAKKIILISLVFVIGFFLIASSLLVYVYFNSPEKTLQLGAEIEEVVLSEDGSMSYIKLKGGSNDKEITSVKFIFTDVNGNEHIYETFEGVKEVSVPYTMTFWDWILGKQKYEGVYDYEINASDVGLIDFSNIIKLEPIFTFPSEEGEIIDSPILDTRDIPTITGGGGGSSSGGDGNGDDNAPASCLNDAGCLSIGSFCDKENINLPYNCSLGSDGCFDRVNGSECDEGYYCSGGSCELDVCYGVSNCSYYKDSSNCTDKCGLKCMWDIIAGCIDRPVFTYYLDANNGNDSWDGKYSTSQGDGIGGPWKTINRANPKSLESPKVNSGDTVILKEGNYGSFKLIDYNNTEKRWITYKAENKNVNFSWISIGQSSSRIFDTYVKLDGINIINDGTFPLGYHGLLSLGGVNHFILNNSYFDGGYGLLRTPTNGLVISERSSTSFSNYVTIENTEIYDFFNGISITGSNNIIIKNNTIHHTRDASLYASYGCYNTLIENNHIYDSVVEPVPIGFEGTHVDILQIFDITNNITIRGNKIHDGEQGIFLKQMENAVIENNIVYGKFGNHINTLHTNMISGIVRNNTYVVSGDGDVAIYSNIYSWFINSNYSVTRNVLVDGNSYTCKIWHTSNDTNKPGTGEYWQDYWRQVDMTFQVYNNIMAHTFGVDSDFGQTLIEDHNLIGSYVGSYLGPKNETDYVYGPSFYSLNTQELRELFVNVPEVCYRIPYSSSSYTGILGNFGNYTTLSVPGGFLNISNPYSVGILSGDNALTCYNPAGLTYPEKYTHCKFLRIKEMTNDIIVLYQNITNTPGTNVNFVLFYSPSNESRIYINNSYFDVGAYIDYNNEEIALNITNKNNDSYGDYIDIIPSMTKKAKASKIICNWGQEHTNVIRDFHPLMDSPACDGSIYKQGTSVGALPCKPCTEGTKISCQTGFPSICSEGKKTCASGLYENCVANIQPGQQQEICNNLIDDDCDDKPDCLDDDCSSDPHCENKQGLVLYLNLNNNTNDWSGWGNNGIWKNGNATYNLGVMDKAAVFDDSDKHIQVPDNELLNFGSSTDFSVLIWFKTNKTCCAPLIEKQGAYLMKVSPTLWVVTGSGSLEFGSGPAINDNQWHHAVMTANRDGNLSAYVDGDLTKSIDMSAVGNITTTGPIRIGASVSGGYKLDGSIDEVMIYNRALSAEEIWEIYDGQLGAQTESGLVSNWKFETETFGITPDETGINNGTLVNAVIQPDAERGSILSLDGTGDYVNLVNPTSLNFTTEDITISGWAKVEPTGYRNIFSHRTGTAGYTFGVQSMFIGNSTTYRFKSGYGTSVLDSEWHYYTIVFKRDSSVYYYFDGYLDATYSIDTLNGADISNSGDYRIGTYATQYLNGSMDDVMIYNRALNSSEILRIYCSQGGTGVICGLPGKTYYVDKLINDCIDYNPLTRTCGSGADWAYNTIQETADRVVQGDTILVREGIYNESVTLTKSGTAESRIIIKNYPNEHPIIDGSVNITGWHNCLSADECDGNSNWQNIYYADLPNTTTPFLNLMQGNEFLYMSQYPNPSNRFYMDDIDEYLSVPKQNIGPDSMSITDNRLEQLGGSSLIGSYVYVHHSSNQVAAKKILDYNTIEKKIIIEKIIPKYDPTQYSIFNNLNSTIFDSEGEYYLNDTSDGNGHKRLYLWPLHGANPESAGVTRAVKGRLLSFKGNNYTTVEGFIFQKTLSGHIITTEFGGNNFGNIFRDNELRFGDAMNVPGSSSLNFIYIIPATNFTAENNYLHDSRWFSRGFDVSRAENIIIRNNVFYNMGGDGVQLWGCKNCEIINNSLSNFLGNHGGGIKPYGGGENVLVAGNRFINCPSSIAFQGVNNLTIYNNIIIGGQISEWNIMSGRLVIANNLIQGGERGLGGMGYAPADTIFMNNIFEKGGAGNKSRNIYMSSWTNYIINNSNEITGANESPIDRTLVFKNTPKTIQGLADYDYAVSNGHDINTNFIYLPEHYEYLIKEGDYMLYRGDDVIRIVTKNSTATKYHGNHATRIEFTPNITNLKEEKFEFWKDISNLTIDYSIKSDSISIDNGTDLSNIIDELQKQFPDYDFYKGIDGNPRPSGNGWDVGPYEYISGGSGAGSLSPFTRLWDFIKGILTKETGKAIFTGNVVGIDGISISNFYEIYNKTNG